MSPRRLDRELVARHLVSDIAEAETLIRKHRVMADGSIATKPSTQVAPQTNLKVVPPPPKYVSRGGEKLEGALGDLGISAQGTTCLDAGAGNGGFTDCLLRRGAKHVTAVDVARGALDWKLRSDPRVTVVEETNVRTLSPSELPGQFDLITGDLSFISLKLVIPHLAKRLAPGGDLLLLVKPQFEAKRREVEPGGLVHDPRIWEQTVLKIAATMEEHGLATAGVVPSHIKGAHGNQEFFLWARADGLGDKDNLVRDAVRAAQR